jgi:hypothetical protein
MAKYLFEKQASNSQGIVRRQALGSLARALARPRVNS